PNVPSWTRAIYEAWDSRLELETQAERNLDRVEVLIFQVVSVRLDEDVPQVAVHRHGAADHHSRPEADMAAEPVIGLAIEAAQGPREIDDRVVPADPAEEIRSEGRRLRQEEEEKRRLQGILEDFN